jgi:hypothetical protein
MLTALVVLTIISGVASLLGFAFVFFGRVTLRYKILCAIGFALAAAWSGYVLMVPGSSTERNVASKIAYYRFPSVDKKSQTLLIQRGSFTLFGVGPISIEFSLPFRDPPEIEIINFRGYDPGEVPSVEKATSHQFEAGLQHMLALGFPQAAQNREFRWVARGMPLEEKSEK